ncbi:tRNA intron endonuclease, catalytic C-terminal domain containing protein [Tritrichomonas foetus]|uniref:tRNA-intron lyase n=1 Tax=Tritrichomonas foetus TaxID=1144522 RepID=A0A1J4K8T9_9EUKA|nr:tRNA intron endonuclease, catalytic C-terminal domain containing protein [Tritrichomonas foetus]|eukprot:OHT05853.1 tRNA intron endonuclease, catalytic C-terminal domain containing protein [Tritrichomonas foetus]
MVNLINHILKIMKKYQKSTIISTTSNGKFKPTDPLPDLTVSKLGSLFIISDDCEGQEIIFKSFAFGKKINNIFILSPYEVMFLKQIQCNMNLKENETQLWKHCCSFFGPSIFPIHYAIYHFFRCRYWVVRDGSIFGAIFVLYIDHPDQVHSKYTVSLINDWDQVTEIAPSITRVDWAIRKSRILVKVNVPTDSNFDDPSCISNFTIEAICVKRIKVS